MSKFTQRLQETQYNIAILDNTIEGILEGEQLRYRLMKYDNKDTWYADPFILDVTENEYLIFAEEMQYSCEKARISKLVIDKESMELKSVIPLLTLPTHLSYPAIIRSGKDIYVYPESGLSGKLTRYKYDPVNERLIEDTVIIEGPLADATIVDYQGSTYLFFTKLPDCNGKELFIYKMNEDGQYTLFQIVMFEENIARMAGAFFTIGDTLYRPAQDCNKCYGNGTLIQKVEIVNGKFEFTEVRRYFSPDNIYNVGIHTLNSYRSVVVVDVDGKPRYPLVRKIVKIIKSFLKKD